jgi:hypothetical protein
MIEINGTIFGHQYFKRRSLYIDFLSIAWSYYKHESNLKMNVIVIVVETNVLIRYFN